MNHEELYASARESARGQKRRALLRLTGYCLVFGLIALFAGGCLMSAFAAKTESPLLGLLILLLTSPAWFLACYLPYKKIDGIITEIHDINDNLAGFRILKDVLPGTFIENAKQNSVIQSMQTFVTPEFIMTRGQFQSCLPLRQITALTIEPHIGKHSYLLLKANCGADCRMYRVECHDFFYKQEQYLREQAGRITECFRLYAPQCSITSPYTEQFEQPPAPMMMQRF